MNYYKICKKNFVLIAIIIIICCILYGLLVFRVSENFESVPDVCGTTGYKMSDGIVSFLNKMFGGNIKNDVRLYTPKQCVSLDNGELLGDHCFKPKTDTEDEVNYNKLCSQLNNTNTIPPDECSVDNILLGKPIKGGTYKCGAKNDMFNFQDNMIRIYTKNECEKILKASFTPLSELLQGLKFSKIDTATVLKDNGKNYGVCVDYQKGQGQVNYSIMCTTPEADTSVKKASRAITDGVRGYLKDFLDG
jgi:hypothetical protein